MQAIKFNVGQTYSGRFMCDYDSVAHFTIISRTAKSVKVAVHGKVVTRRVSDYYGYEQFKPFGSYSMCMVIDAKAPDLSQPVEDVERFHEFAANVRNSLGEC